MYVCLYILGSGQMQRMPPLEPPGKARIKCEVVLCPDPQPPERPPEFKTWMQKQGFISKHNTSQTRNSSKTLNAVRAGGASLLGLQELL